MHHRERSDQQPIHESEGALIASAHLDSELLCLLPRKSHTRLHTCLPCSNNFRRSSALTSADIMAPTKRQQ